MASSEKPPKTVSYGRWESPISADAFAAGSVELDQVVVDVRSRPSRVLPSCLPVLSDRRFEARLTSSKVAQQRKDEM